MLKKIMKKEDGFTLAELLIVVAIIAVLVAVSIPIFTSQLEKSRESTDMANLRAAKAAAVSAYLTDETVGSKTLGSSQNAAVEVFYDASAGKLVDSAPANKYGKGTSATGSTTSSDAGLSYTPSTEASGKVIKVTVATDGTCTFAWQ